MKKGENQTESRKAALAAFLSLDAPEEKTLLWKAQDLIYDAWEMPSRRARAAAARRALKICPDCADAYVMLAKGASSVAESLRLSRLGVEAGERVLGEERLKSLAGACWGVLETRPYMRARAELAKWLWEAGEREESIAHYRAMIELNTNDNQGIRYLLVNCLIGEKQDLPALALLRRYKGDITADWAYSTALCWFRLEGPGNKANRALVSALRRNAFVPEYLLGLKPLPVEIPDSMSLGSEDEAADYADRADEAWETTPYALDWLQERVLRRK
jgi:hypothetical protein